MSYYWDTDVLKDLINDKMDDGQTLYASIEDAERMMGNSADKFEGEVLNGQTPDSNDMLGERAVQYNIRLGNRHIYCKCERCAMSKIAEESVQILGVIKRLDGEVQGVFAGAKASITAVDSADTKTETSVVKENDAKAGSEDNTEVLTNNTGVSSVTDADGNTIDFNNFELVPFISSYDALSDADHQKTLFALGETLDPDVQKYFTDWGYPLDGFGWMGIAVGESGAKMSSSYIFGTNGGAGGNGVGEGTKSKGVDEVAEALVKAGVCKSTSDAKNLINTDKFYGQLAAAVGCAHNTVTWGMNPANTWEVLNTSKHSVKTDVPRWRNNYKNGTADKSSGGYGGGGRNAYYG